MSINSRICLGAVSLIAALLTTGAAQAGERWPSSELLLPCFEVRLDGSASQPPSLTTILSVVNSADRQVPVQIKVLSNWGLEMLSTQLVLEPHEVKTVDLASWILAGQDPADPPGAPPVLHAQELAHVQAALCGQPSPQTGEYYSSPVDRQKPMRAVGSVVIRVLEVLKPDVLWGIFFVVEPGTDFAQGEVLANLDPYISPGANDDDDLCAIHAFRFLTSPPDVITEFMVWNGSWASSTPDGVFPGRKIPAIVTAYAKSGAHIATLEIDLLPMEIVQVADLGLPEEFGWLHVDTQDVETMIAVRYNTSQRFSVGMEAFCLPRQAQPGSGIDIEKSTNGVDADQPPGRPVAANASLTWTYFVTNTGEVPLSGITVIDSQGLDVDCPRDALEPGESMTCIATGTADPEACQYRNDGRATGTAPDGSQVTDFDPSHYFLSENASIAIEKATNGHDADSAPGPTLSVGDPVKWTYVVTNNGGVELHEIQVSDNQGLAVSCPQDALQPGESMTCTANGTAMAGQYSNRATVTANSFCSTVTDSDSSHYYGVCRECLTPAIRIEKSTNGEDADTPPGPGIAVGAAVAWTYRVINIGQVPLSGVTVTDDQGVAVSCPQDELQPGESMTCTASALADPEICSYVNQGWVSGTAPDGTAVSDHDPSHYFLFENPSIDLEKATNGHDADSAPGPTLLVGGPVQWTYVVTNSGDVPLTGVQVIDDQGVRVSCPQTVLGVGEAMTCSASGTAVEGSYSNLGTAMASSFCSEVADSDPSHYWGQGEDGQGCTPGYWKNHPDSWPPTGYAPSQSVSSVLAESAAFPGIGSASLIEALDFGGGPGVEGAAKILLRAAVAGLLNAWHPGVSYPRNSAQVISQVNAALASGDRDTMLSLASAIDADNNSGCPLN